MKSGRLRLPPDGRMQLATTYLVQYALVGRLVLTSIPDSADLQASRDAGSLRARFAVGGHRTSAAITTVAARASPTTSNTSNNPRTTNQTMQRHAGFLNQ
jgi:hypothetical protein